MTKLLVTPDSVALPANQSVNVNQVGGAALTEGQKAMSASVPVVVASDQSTLPVNNAQVGGTAIVTAAAGVQRVGIADSANAAITLGSKVSASSVPVVVASDQGAIPVVGTKTTNNAAPGATNVGVLPALANAAAPAFTEGNQVTLSTDLLGNLRTSVAAVDPVKASYSASILGLSSAALATDIFLINGSATKLVRIMRIVVSAVQTTAGEVNLQVLKRSTANAGGTSTAPTVVSHDSNDVAGTAVVLAYTANPTSVGTLVGLLRAERIFVPPAAATSAGTVEDINFTNIPAKPIILRGVAQGLAINLNGVTVTGGNFDISVDWTEE
jgi:hypothetical protein